MQESKSMSLDTRLSNRAFMASYSSSESQELNGSGTDVLEDKLVEVVTWLVVVSTIGVSSLAGGVVAVVEEAKRTSKSNVLASGGAGNKGVTLEAVSFSTSYSEIKDWLGVLTQTKY